MKESKAILIVFGEELPERLNRGYKEVVAKKNLKQAVESAGLRWVDLDGLAGPGSIYQATMLLEELPHLKLADGTPVAKSFLYKGYELWWMHYDSLFYHFCLPYTRYRKLLEYLKDFPSIYFYKPPHANLFSSYLEAYGRKINVIPAPGLHSPSFLPFGVLLQIILTFIFLPALVVLRRPIMVYVGDKFEKGKDHDFRFRFVYEELRRKKLPFVEFIRGVESWRSVLEHVFVRKRPVIYSETAVFIGRFLSVLTGGRSSARKKFGADTFPKNLDPETRFKLSLSTLFLIGVYEDVWAIRIMRLILSAVGVETGLITAGSQRNFPTVLGCKLNGIPTVGILHGVASRFYNVYEFMPGFNGEKRLSVDTYGLWSEWWKSYFIKYSRIYAPEQLYVSGPMRPLLKIFGVPDKESSSGITRVLFVSEEVAAPEEVLPYLEELLRRQDIKLTLKFRPSRDGFEQWLILNNPGVLKRENLNIVRGSMQEAIAVSDVAVGCQSTGVLEALQQTRVPIYFRTEKWGDYYELADYAPGQPFFAENPEELVQKIRGARAVPDKFLEELKERFFGDPTRNGSAWVVEQLQKNLET